MAIIAVPPGIRTIDWRLPVSQRFAVTSGWTGGQRIADLGGLSRGFVAAVTVVPGTAAHGRLWRAFFSALKGPVNTFLLDPGNAGQLVLPADSVLVAGAGQTGATLNVDGAPASLPLLARAGDVVTIGGRGHVVQADVGTNGSGQAALVLDPPIIAAPANDSLVLLRRPRIEMFLPEGEPGWSSRPGAIAEPFGFTALERVPA